MQRQTSMWVWPIWRPVPAEPSKARTIIRLMPGRRNARDRRRVLNNTDHFEVEGQVGAGVVDLVNLHCQYIVALDERIFDHIVVEGIFIGTANGVVGTCRISQRCGREIACEEQIAVEVDGRSVVTEEAYSQAAVFEGSSTVKTRRKYVVMFFCVPDASGRST